MFVIHLVGMEWWLQRELLSLKTGYVRIHSFLRMALRTLVVHEFGLEAKTADMVILHPSLQTAGADRPSSALALCISGATAG